MTQITLFYILLVLVVILAPLVLLQRRKVALHWMFLGLALSQTVAGGAIYLTILASMKASVEPAYHDTYYVVASFHAFINPVLVPAVLALLTGLAALVRSPVHRTTGIVAFWVLAVSSALMTTPSLYLIETTGYAQTLTTKPASFTALVFRAEEWAGAGYLLSLASFVLLLVSAGLTRLAKIGGIDNAP